MPVHLAQAVPARRQPAAAVVEPAGPLRRPRRLLVVQPARLLLRRGLWCAAPAQRRLPPRRRGSASPGRAGHGADPWVHDGPTAAERRALARRRHLRRTAAVLRARGRAALRRVGAVRASVRRHRRRRAGQHRRARRCDALPLAARERLHAARERHAHLGGPRQQPQHRRAGQRPGGPHHHGRGDDPRGGQGARRRDNAP
mmetsp:Transcript_9546/g.29506  ORF Transcript_9546/g.29506 Transcript_9546/m.29506 type:complete len:200 (+) Transcript_9546:346-945(+)